MLRRRCANEWRKQHPAITDAWDSTMIGESIQLAAAARAMNARGPLNEAFDRSMYDVLRDGVQVQSNEQTLGDIDLAATEARVAALMAEEKHFRFMHDEVIVERNPQLDLYARALAMQSAWSKPKQRPGFIGEPVSGWGEPMPHVPAHVKPRKVFPGTVRALVNPAMNTGPLLCGSTDDTGGWRESAYGQRGGWRGDPLPFNYYSKG